MAFSCSVPWIQTPLLKTRFQFALFVVSFFVAKVVHLSNHASSLPIVLYLLYMPTFLLADIVLLVGSKLLIYTRNSTSFLKKLTGAVIAIFTASLSTAQLSFFFETGGDIQWIAAGHLAKGGGMRLMLSGFPMFALLYLFICTIAWLVSWRLYDGVEYALEEVKASFKNSYDLLFKRGKTTDSQEKLLDGLEEEEGTAAKGKTLDTSDTRALFTSFSTILVISTTLTLLILRPTTQPYAHMSGSLPLTFFSAFLFEPLHSEFCLARPSEDVDFPFELFLNFTKHHTSSSVPPNWSPVRPECRERARRNEWQESSVGLAKGDDTTKEIKRRSGHQYEPACDPLKLSNLDQNLLSPLEDALKSQEGDPSKQPLIKNVLLITLESTRKDMFPFKKGSRAYEKVVSSYDSSFDPTELDAKLQKLTETSAFLSGEETGFGREKPSGDGGGWRSLFARQKGGINVHNVTTQSTFTFKSLYTSHCGVEPLAVDYTEEVKGSLYQLCLPQIMDLFNTAETDEKTKGTFKEQPTSSENFVSWPWDSALIQSITDQFDSQDLLDSQMGFRNVIVESTISNSSSKHYPPKEAWSNYFGYPETETLDYFYDLFTDSKQQKKRLFVSHVTSSTHHPFAVPPGWEGEETYVNLRKWRGEESFDRYLNTIKYQDEWIDKVFDMLYKVGVLNETLVVLVGDHGSAFNFVDSTQSTYENPHISNFAIPLLFVHPHLPRIQIPAKGATPLSVIPTILDLLLQTHSLSSPAASKAEEILPRYQGHSMIRELKYTVPSSQVQIGDSDPSSLSKTDSAPSFFQPFQFSVMNPGGSLLAINDASRPYRLIIPLCSNNAIRFTDLSTDPYEEQPVVAWTMKELSKKLRKSLASKEDREMVQQWVELAEETGRWWFWNQRRLWRYWGCARGVDRSAVGGSIGGQIKKKHWWET